VRNRNEATKQHAGYPGERAKVNECNRLISSIIRYNAGTGQERHVVTALASPFIALLSAWLWTWFVAPAILRAFGVPMVSGQWRWNRRDKHLSKRQYVWGYGVFAWGTGMFLFFVLTDYLSWRMLGDRFSRPTPVRVALELVIFLGAGWTVGAYGAPKHTT
jgi:hypothetical protein